ncbi:hypothetical protein BZG36_04312 [Bifiguratus adelaidae]|uniref:Probable RNA-binding protein 18 n=1 Tax=Bifiguratus adelaidae TaxID=1938954 RepID=A0A261XZP1_9FUNG|nr:hypothetical protein BZG36_04312 [Bifiguratus adelaidae]
MSSNNVNTRRLYVGNLDSTIDEYSIVKLFEPFGKITSLDFLFHLTGPRKGQPRGYCFLEYANKTEALQAISAMHRKTIKGRPLVVTFAHAAKDQDRDQKGSVLSRPTQKLTIANTKSRIAALEKKIALLEKSKSGDTAPPKSTDGDPQTRTNQSTSKATQRNHPYRRAG